MFSDVFGKASRSIIGYISDHPGEPFDVAPFIDRRCKHPIEDIQEAVDAAVSHEQAAKPGQILQHIDELSAHRANIESEINRHAEPYAYQLELLRTIPGFSADPLSAVTVLSENGTGTVFRRLVSHLS